MLGHFRANVLKQFEHAKKAVNQRGSWEKENGFDAHFLGFPDICTRAQIA